MPPVVACGSRLGRVHRDALTGAWVDFFAPHFDPPAIYFTGTYSDDYGYANGCTLPRNVVKDFKRFCWWIGFTGEFVVCAEPHADREVHHLHAIMEPTAADIGLAADSTRKGAELQLAHGGSRVEDAVDRYRTMLDAFWATSRGHSRVLPVKDGCLSYVTKYVLKDENADSLDWSWA